MRIIDVKIQTATPRLRCNLTVETLLAVIPLSLPYVSLLASEGLQAKIKLN